MDFSRFEIPFARSLYPAARRLLDDHLDWRLTGRWMMLSALVGVICAIGALIFSHLVSLTSDGFLLRLVGYEMPLPGGEAGGAVFDLETSLNPTRRWLLFFVPALGGLVSGWLVFRFAPDAEGHGTDAVIRAFHRNAGRMDPRIPIVKTLASAATIGTGGSAGREGPIAHIGAAMASMVAQRLELSDRERRILMVAGVAAGIGSIFRSPLGGAFFAVEVLYRDDMETEALMPAVVAGITGYSVYSTFEGSGTVFTPPSFQYVSPFELFPIVGFALLCAAMGIVYVNTFYGVKRRLFDGMKVPRAVKPAIGGLVVGAIAFFFPPILGSSYGWLQHAMDGTLPFLIMATLVVTKIIATSFTIGSGGSGGVFAPSLVIGGMLGGVFGSTMHAIWPEVVTQPEAYVMIGMATLFSGVSSVPISMTIMISEMTGSYALLVPLIFAGVIVHLLVNKWSLYTEQVRAHADSPAHRSEVLPNVLAALKVEQVVRRTDQFHVLEPKATLDEILSVFTGTEEVVIPISEPGSGRRYDGLVVLNDVQSLMAPGDSMRQLIIASDVQVPFVSVRLADTLEQALDAFQKTTSPELPVVDADGLIVGFLREGQVVSEYHRAVLRAHADSAHS